MADFDEIRRLNRERANASLYLYGLAAMNTPADLEGQIQADAQHRLALDAWRKAEEAYRAAVDGLSHSELLDLIRAEPKQDSAEV